MDNVTEERINEMVIRLKGIKGSGVEEEVLQILMVNAVRGKNVMHGCNELLAHFEVIHEVPKEDCDRMVKLMGDMIINVAEICAKVAVEQ